MDRVGTDGEIVDVTGTLDARGNGDAGFHQSGVLFDQADRFIPDEFTGETHKDSSDFEGNGLVVRELGASALDDVMSMSGDAAANWLAENDPDLQESV